MNYVRFLASKIALLFLVTICFSQTNIKEKNSDLKIRYSFEYKKFAESENFRNSNAILFTNSEESLFIFEGMLSIDSIQRKNNITQSELLLYRPPYFLLIKTKNENTYHYEMIGNDFLKIEEDIDANWKFINETKKIGPYSCKKATINYYGRNWTAWYTNEIPVDVGPYKFHGLPGLILSISDSENIFKISAVDIKLNKTQISDEIDNYFISENEVDFEQITPDKFYEFKNKFYSMTLNQKLKFMNRNNEGTHSLVITSTNGEKPRTNKKAKKRNFIERFD